MKAVWNEISALNVYKESFSVYTERKDRQYVGLVFTNMFYLQQS